MLQRATLITINVIQAGTRAWLCMV